MDAGLTMFIWENVLRDYTSGMIAVLAHDVTEATKLVREKYGSLYADECVADQAKIITIPEAFAVFGGG